MTKPDAGLTPDAVVEAYKQDVDRSLLRANLRRSPTERLANLVALQRFAEELRRAGRAARRLEALAELEARSEEASRPDPET